MQLTWDPKKHPRGKTGSGSGGQFAPLSYDSSRKTGTGYAKAHGDDRVRQAQGALRKAGFTDMHGESLKEDGKLGPKTTASIKKYQRTHGLKPDGKITPALLSALKKGGPMPGAKKKPSTAAVRRRAATKTTSRTAGKQSQARRPVRPQE